MLHWGKQEVLWPVFTRGINMGLVDQAFLVTISGY